VWRSDKKCKLLCNEKNPCHEETAEIVRLLDVSPNTLPQGWNQWDTAPDRRGKSTFVTIRRPSIATTLFLLVMMVLYLVGPALAWGRVSGLLAHPARAGMFLVGLIGAVVFFFSGCNLASFNWNDRASRVTLVVSILVWLPLIYLPAYGDRHDIAVWDGEIVRYAGLATYAIGCVLRIGPMFVLKNRFRAP
jgi:hypothetical protein